MKEKKFKLSLKKQVVSNLKTNSVVGGSGACEGSRIDVNGCASQAGCLGGPDETLTCCGYSCSCPTFGPFIING